MLNAIQRGLELLYRVETELDVRDFMIDAATRAAIGVARAPREQLLVAERDGDLEMALFVDERTLARLAEKDPRKRLDDGNLQDFLLVVEGVSHFVYLAWRARHQRPVSALDLELQAEVDKYVTCLLTLLPQGAPPADLRARLFERFHLEPGLDGEERDRYLVANSNARAYSNRLEQLALGGSLPAMLAELRWFYRLGVQEKLSYIAKAA